MGDKVGLRSEKVGLRSENVNQKFRIRKKFSVSSESGATDRSRRVEYENIFTFPGGYAIFFLTFFLNSPNPTGIDGVSARYPPDIDVW
jgi:hypothetical protein